jgi:DUF1680 family protein
MVAAAWKNVKLESSLPWEGRVGLTVRPEHPVDFTLHLRIPSWAGNTSLKVNGSPLAVSGSNDARSALPASGYDPHHSRFFSIPRRWSPDDRVDLEFELPVVLRKASPRLRGHKNRVALSKGPLVYCLESVDNPGMDIFRTRIDPETIRVESDRNLLGGIQVLRGKTKAGGSFTAIPYQLWANRGESQMAVWLNV